MEYKSSILFEKDLAAISEKHIVYIYDTKTNKLVQNYKFTDAEITSCNLKSDSSNEDRVLLLITDKYGNLHLFDITKNQKLTFKKIHDSEIIQCKVSAKKNFIYTLDRNGIIKYTNFANYSNLITEKTFNLQTSSTVISNNQNRIIQKIFFFDLDKKEKNLVFNKGLKIKVLNLEKNLQKTIGMHSSQISYLTYSDDSRFVVSSTEKDYFIYLWDWKSNLGENKAPTICLQVNSLTNKTVIRKVENNVGIYHAFSFNNEYVYGHFINLDVINTKSTGTKGNLNNSSNRPLPHSFLLHSSEKNLINLELDLSLTDLITDRNTHLNILIVYGNTFFTSNVVFKKVKYANNFKNFITEEMTLPLVRSKANLVTSKLEQGKVIINKNFAVLNEVEMNENTHKGNELNVTQTEEDPNQDADDSTVNTNNNSISTIEEKISLINLIKNSIINNDISTLEWTLDQNDHSIIETTVRKMNKSLIKLFISKLMELFQSNLILKSKTNFLKWIELLFKYHSVEILKMPVNILNTLNKINIIINTRTKNLERLIEINQKFEGIINEINLNQNEQKKSGKEFVSYEPLLIYNESDSEDDVRKKKKIEEEVKNRGINITKEKEYLRKKKEFEEYVGDVDMFVDEKAFEDDAMEDLDKLEQEDKNENDKEDDMDEDDEEFEDDD